MSGSPPTIPIARCARLAVCLPVAAVAAAELARLPSVLGLTLGVPVSPWGAVPLIAVAAAGLHSLWRSPSVLGAGFGAILVLAAFVCLDVEVPRRRGLALALGAAITIDLCRAALSYAASLAPGHGRWRAQALRLGPPALLLTTAALAAFARVFADRAPLRGTLSLSTAQPRLVNAEETRSIVLITMDTTRLRDLGCYGQGRATTPNLDRFAASAARFTRAYSTSPFTAPSLGSILTGRLPVDHGSIAASPVLAPDTTTLAEHCYAAGFETAGFLDNPWLGTDFGLARGYEYLSRQTELGEIERWLDARAGRRFLLHVHLFQPHGPYDLQRAELAAIGGTTVPEAAARIGASLSARRIRAGEVPGRSGLSEDEVHWAHDMYLTEVRAMDRWIGDLLQLLEARRLLNSSVIAIAADHGEEFGERGGLHHSHTLFGELVHVPLLLRAPGLAPGLHGETVSLGGVGPGLVELAGLAPMERSQGGQGAPSPWIAEPGDAVPRSPALSMRCRQGGRHFLRVTTDRWALHVRLIPGRELLETWLFDLASDPAEEVDVSDQFPGQSKALLALPIVADALAKLRRVPITPEIGRERALAPRTARDLRVLGYAK